MIIYDKANKQILDIPVDDTSYRYRSIMGQHSVTLQYSLTDHVELPVGSYINYQGERYTLWLPQNFKKEGTRNFEYAVEFGSNQQILNKYKYKNTSARPYKLKFSLTAKPQMFIQLLVDNLNLYDSGWAVGKCIEATEKVISFNHEYCSSVLSKLAEEFSTEFEIVGKTINFCKVEKFKDSPLPLSYGKGNGFKTGIGRANEGDKAPITVLYVQGGDRNIDFSTYKSETLLLPKSQELTYEGRRYKTDEHGMSITRAEKAPINIEEDGYDASNIYPMREGTVTKVETEAGKDSDENPVAFYNIIDTTIPEALNFRDCRIPGEKATIIFQTGKLTGREFDIVQTDKDLTGYIHATRCIKLVSLTEGKMTLPNENLCPEIGDKYAVFHISLPDAYVCNNADKTGASWDMFREAVRYFYEHEDDRFTFTGELDGLWAKKRWLEIGGKIIPGGYIQFSDDQFQPDGILIRMVGVKDYVNNPESPIIELSNAPSPGFLSNELGKIESNEVVTDDLFKNSIRYTERRWGDAKELQAMLEKAFVDFSKGVNPIWVQTMAILIGDESLQFRFVDSRSNPTETNHTFSYDDATKVFSTGSAILQHLTLGIDKLSNQHAASEYKFWDMQAFTSPALGDYGAMYLYSKCSKTGTTGTFKMSETAIKMDPGDGFYYFLTGSLSTEVDGVRSFVPLYGFTEIGPGWMRLREIVSQDGITYFDLVKGIIGGRIKFASGSTGYENIQDKPNLGIYGTIDMLNAVKGNLQNQIDGKIETYYQTSNPWQGWSSGTEPAHVGDLWYNTSTKVLQSYVGPSSNTWATIEDAAAIAAADAASKAQDTADGKRRVFLSTPYPPYDAGDQWVQYGAKGDMRICVQGRPVGGRYYASDWQISSADGNTLASIDRGVFTAAGYLTFGGTAGMVGSGNVRIWSGGSNAENATFQVSASGEVSAQKAIKLRDNMAGITGDGTAETSIRIWAGGSNPASAPFRVNRKGEATMSDGSIIGGFAVKDNTLSWRYSGASISIGYRPNTWWGKADCITAKSDSNGNAIAGIAPAGGAGIYGSKNINPNKPEDWSMWAGFFDGNVRADAFFPKGVTAVVGDATLQLDRDGSGAYEMVIKNGIVVSIRNT